MKYNLEKKIFGFHNRTCGRYLTINKCSRIYLCNFESEHQEVFFGHFDGRKPCNGSSQVLALTRSVISTRVQHDVMNSQLKMDLRFQQMCRSANTAWQTFVGACKWVGVVLFACLFVVQSDVGGGCGIGTNYDPLSRGNRAYRSPFSFTVLILCLHETGFGQNLITNSKLKQTCGFGKCATRSHPRFAQCHKISGVTK